jgi:hypothetical protein
MQVGDHRILQVVVCCSASRSRSSCGLLTSEEIAIRGSICFFIFSLVEEDERLIFRAGLELLSREDLTQAVADVLGRWLAARQRHHAALIADEGGQPYEDFNLWFRTVHPLASERRLSRYAFLARKPTARRAASRRGQPPEDDQSSPPDSWGRTHRPVLRGAAVPEHVVRP